MLPDQAPAHRPVELEPIVLGQSCALTGPSKYLGIELRSGLLAALAEADQQGGVNGREIVLLSVDDGYEPYRAVVNTRHLIEKNNVFLMIGEVGTPTSEAVIAFTEQQQVPFFAPQTGADFLRTPFKKDVINIRGSYYQEMETVVSYFVDRLKLSRITCFYKNNSYGRSGLDGARAALDKRGMKLISTGTYERNTVAVLGGTNGIYKAGPQPVLLVGTYTACAEFIKHCGVVARYRRSSMPTTPLSADSCRPSSGAVTVKVLSNMYGTGPTRTKT